MHPLIGDDLGRCAVGQLAALVDDDDPIGDLHHEAHVVLDEQHGDARRGHPADDLPEVGGLGVVEPGGRLVEEHRVRLERHRPGDVDEPLMAGRQRVHRYVGQSRRARRARGSARRGRAPSASSWRPAGSDKRCRDDALADERVAPEHHALDGRHARRTSSVSGRCGRARSGRSRRSAGRAPFVRRR